MSDPIDVVRRVLGGGEREPSWGSATEHERTARFDKPRRWQRKCSCGRRQTHTGLANGVALMGGCEWCVRAWVSDPSKPRPGMWSHIE